MELNKEFIEWFNKNKTKDEYRKIILKYFKESLYCRICEDVIYYYDSSFIFGKNGLKLKGKSFETSKGIDKVYYLSICEDCLSKKYPEYQDKNKSRVFNQMNYLTEYAFDIDHEIAVKWVKEKYAITETNLIKKWGEESGKERWKNYLQKQSFSNTFEYKKEKYGWDEEKFKEYNKSRSVTLENLINRHGEDIGLNIWKRYCDKQKYSTSVEYFIGKYGTSKGIEIYENFCKKRLHGAGYSIVSKELFDCVLNRIPNFKAYYADNEWYYYDKENKKYYLIDFYIKELNVGIEFQGDIWHANPKKYKPNDKPYPFQKDLMAKEIWEKDRIKNDFLKTKLNKLIIIWESDLYKEGIEQTVNKIIKEINE
ncbi:MAG: hypothetical protein EB079_01155 [Verrucomicrobia bacterium]|nr:hypothetical protein [Verrucomicrobiota bacterium]